MIFCTREGIFQFIKYLAACKVPYPTIPKDFVKQFEVSEFFLTVNGEHHLSREFSSEEQEEQGPQLGHG